MYVPSVGIFDGHNVLLLNDVEQRSEDSPSFCQFIAAGGNLSELLPRFTLFICKRLNLDTCTHKKVVRLADLPSHEVSLASTERIQDQPLVGVRESDILGRGTVKSTQQL